MLIQHIINFVGQCRTKNTATQPIDPGCQETFTFFYSLTCFVTDWGQICQKLNDMKKDILKEIAEAMELAFINANKIIQAEKKQKPFSYPIVFGAKMQICNN